MDGSLLDEGRKLLSVTDFKVNGTVEGFAIYKVAVNREGKITSITLEETNVKSTPTKMMMRNLVAGYTFTGASNYPEFQHVRIKITSAKAN